MFGAPGGLSLAADIELGDELRKAVHAGESARNLSATAL